MDERLSDKIIDMSHKVSKHARFCPCRCSWPTQRNARQGRPLAVASVGASCSCLGRRCTASLPGLTCLAPLCCRGEPAGGHFDAFWSEVEDSGSASW